MFMKTQNVGVLKIISTDIEIYVNSDILLLAFLYLFCGQNFFGGGKNMWINRRGQLFLK